MTTWMIEKNPMKHDSLPEKEDFQSHLNIEEITDADYTHAKRVCRHAEILK